jgi:hypothetical protein
MHAFGAPDADFLRRRDRGTGGAQRSQGLDDVAPTPPAHQATGDAVESDEQASDAPVSQRALLCLVLRAAGNSEAAGDARSRCLRSSCP